MTSEEGFVLGVLTALLFVLLIWIGSGIQIVHTTEDGRWYINTHHQAFELKSPKPLIERDTTFLLKIKEVK